MSFKARVAMIVGLGVATAIALLVYGPIPQDQAYHAFADDRTLCGVPNFWNVASNLAFVIPGVAGLAALARRRGSFIEPWEAVPFAVVFAGMVLVGIGSAYYHWRPVDPRLVWDRAALTINMMGLFGIVLIERVSLRWGARLFGPLLLLGAGSVFWWKYTDDLRVYGFVQFFPMGAVPLMLALFPPRYTRTIDLGVVVGWYALAKTCEILDPQIYDLFGRQFSGHTIKHLAAGAASFWVALWMIRRRPVTSSSAAS